MSNLAHTEPQVVRFRLTQRIWLAVVALLAGPAIVLFFAVLADDEATRTPAVAIAAPPEAVRYDGGPEEGTRGLVHAGLAAGVRYDGGPEEGSSGTPSTSSPSSAAEGVRFDGGPEEGSRGLR